MNETTSQFIMIAVLIIVNVVIQLYDHYHSANKLPDKIADQVAARLLPPPPPPPPAM